MLVRRRYLKVILGQNLGHWHQLSFGNRPGWLGAVHVGEVRHRSRDQRRCRFRLRRMCGDAGTRLLRGCVYLALVDWPFLLGVDGNWGKFGGC